MFVRKCCVYVFKTPEQFILGYNFSNYDLHVYCFTSESYSDTELSAGLRAAGIDKFKVKMKNGKPTEMHKEATDDDDDRTISEGDSRGMLQNVPDLPLQPNQVSFQTN